MPRRIGSTINPIERLHFGLMMLIRRQLSIVEAKCTGVLSVIFGLLLTVPGVVLLTIDPVNGERCHIIQFGTILPRWMLLTELLVTLSAGICEGQR